MVWGVGRAKNEREGKNVVNTMDNKIVWQCHHRHCLRNKISAQRNRTWIFQPDIFNWYIFLSEMPLNANAKVLCILFFSLNCLSHNVHRPSLISD